MFKSRNQSTFVLLMIVCLLGIFALIGLLASPQDTYAVMGERSAEYEIKILTDEGFLWIANDTCTLGGSCKAGDPCGIVSKTPVKLVESLEFDFEQFKEHFGKSAGFQEGKIFEYFTYRNEIFGWHNDTVPYMSQSTIVIIPEYSIENYEFIFQVQGVEEAPYPQFYTSEDTLMLPRPLNREGYFFEGWKTTKIDGNTISDGIFYAQDKLESSDVLGDMTEGEQSDTIYELTAVFRAMKTNIILVSGKGYVSKPTFTVSYDEILSLPTLYGGNYRFQGWYDNEEFGGVLYTDKTIWKKYDLNGGELQFKLYAKWLGVPASVSYDLEGGTTENPQTYLDSFTLASATKSGYRFDGWLDTDSQQKITQLNSGDYHLKAIWTKYILKPTKATAEFTIADMRATYDFDQSGKDPTTIIVAPTVNYIEFLGGRDRTFTLTASIIVSSRDTELSMKINAKFAGSLNKTALTIEGSGDVHFVECDAEIRGGVRASIGDILDGKTYCSAIYSTAKLFVDGRSTLNLYGGAGFITGSGEEENDAFEGGTALYAMGLTVYSGARVYAYGGNGGSAYNTNANGGPGRYGIRLSPLVGLTNYGYVYCKGGKGGAGNGTGRNGADYAPINACIVQGSGTLVKENA